VKPAAKYFLTAAIVVVVDQAVKLAVKLNMNLREGIDVLGGFFQIYFIENDGAAFGTTVDGILSGVGVVLSPELGKLILFAFSIIAVGGIGYMLYRMREHHSVLPYFLALIFGGAVGNIIDRTFYGVLFEHMNAYDGGFLRGQVVDMFYFDIYKGVYPASLQWLPWVKEDSYLFIFPVFNVADAALSIGICVLLVFQGRFFRQDTAANEAKVAAAATPAATVTAGHPAQTLLERAAAAGMVQDALTNNTHSMAQTAVAPAEETAVSPEKSESSAAPSDTEATPAGEPAEAAPSEEEAIAPETALPQETPVMEISPATDTTSTDSSSLSPDAGASSLDSFSSGSGSSGSDSSGSDSSGSDSSGSDSSGSDSSSSDF